MQIMKDEKKIMARIDNGVASLVTAYNLTSDELTGLNRILLSTTLQMKLDYLCQSILFANRVELDSLLRKYGKYCPEVVYSKYPILAIRIEEEVNKKNKAKEITKLKRQGKTLEQAKAEAEILEALQKIDGSRTFGYARVSTKEQNLDRQIKALNKVNVDMIFEEKISGKNTKREQLQLLLDTVKDGDTIIVSELTRISRSTKDLVELVDSLEQKGVKIKSLKEEWLDTTTASGKFMLTIFSGMAQFERELMLERQAEGIAVAKEKGTSFGVKLDPEADINTAIKLYQQGDYSCTKIAKMCNISRSTLYRNLRKCGLL